MFMCSNCDFMDCYNTVLFLNGVIFVFLRVEPWGGSIGGFSEHTQRVFTMCRNILLQVTS
jgi:hypothetical protein